jgi:hypothetical protein
LAVVAKVPPANISMTNIERIKTSVSLFTILLLLSSK